ncbi:MAG: FG-GAP repeat protein, partial [Proteobacteria bacterium]|nr:FG-GAP repeat protein [Pseudomonadota bacterium]
MKNGQFPAVLPLASLNGRNGFKIDGENNGDHCGVSVSSAGDINVDGYTDLLIGAEAHNNWVGRSYVVFGGPGIGSSGILNLADLNGSNGFKLDGEEVNDSNGWSVKGAGDVNGDGMADFLTVSQGYNSLTGRTYVVFGKAGIDESGLLSLSSLNGTNGVKLDGETTNDYSGNAVGAVDLNGDNYSDILIGAPNYNGLTGRSYVVFGASLTSSGNGQLLLSTLNGTNGFKLDGEPGGGQSGWWVDGAGDINNDGKMDLLVSAWLRNSFAGCSYVVFGASNFSAIVPLSGLNGTNGFKLNGETAGDRSGGVISSAGMSTRMGGTIC